MDSSQVDTLVKRLVVNPHDEQALATAHHAGASDPKSYALLLERVGAETPDSAYASHWLAEAANVWSTTLGDAHRAARVLMQAIERDPTQRTAADRLAELYREKGDFKALVALLERRAKALTPLVLQSPEVRAELTAMHEELGRLWSDNLHQPKKALDNYKRAMDLDPSSAFAIYGAREIYKALGQLDDASAMFEAELRIESDPARKLALLRDESATRRSAGDLPGSTRALARARLLDPQDPALQQEYGALVVERLVKGENVSGQERTVGAELLVGLAEAYDGEHGLAYSAGALDIDPGHDRALQLYAYYARALEREDDVASRYLAYLQANPSGAMATDARWLLAASYEGAQQFPEAIGVLEPLRAAGDAQAAKKLEELHGRISPERSSAPASRFETAQALSNAGQRDEAYAEYQRVLERDPAHSEALSWVEDYLRTKRDYRALRDVLLSAVRVPNQPPSTRQDWLREVAGLSEGNLRDIDGAIDAWKQLLALDRTDESARQALTRALEKTQRWDDLALMVEYEASAQTDVEKKIALEKRLATLHEQRRQDFAAAAEAWERIGILTPEDDQAVFTSAALFEKAGLLDRAAQVIAASTQGVDDPAARDSLNERLGQLRERLGDPGGAGEAYVEAARSQRTPKLWEAAERCFVAAQHWGRASVAAQARAELDADPLRQARHHARAADHSGRAGDEAAFVEQLTLATNLDPASDDFARALGDHYSAIGRFEDLVALLLRRSDRLTEASRRVAARREAARMYGQRLGNKDAARATWQNILEDGEDREALEQLVSDAVEREDYADATALSRRLEAVVPDRVEKTRIALREAELVADGLGDVATAIARYERVLSELDPTCRPALQAIADLQEAGDNPAAAADALEREMRLVEGAESRGPIAERLSRLYEQLERLDDAIRALDVVRLADPEDFDALSRLCALCEKTENWEKLTEHLAERIEVEADDEEVSSLTQKLAGVLAEKLHRGDEALAVLEELASRGDEAVQNAYIELGDRLGWHGIVASKIVEWWLDAKPGPARVAHLRGAFERFAEVGRDEDAVRVGREIARSKGADSELAHSLEQLAVKTTNLDALSVAHELLARDVSGPSRAEELVRQAEVQLRAGAPRTDALHHGEGGLASVAPDKAEPLLARLAVVAKDPGDVVELYERQIGRCKLPADRIAALARAAQVAASQGALERASALFDLALGSTPTEEAVKVLERAALEADVLAGGDNLRRTLSVAMAGGGQGARDGGRTRGSLLRRAASIAYGELKDLDKAFTWLGDALVAHVDAATLDALDALAAEVADFRRADATLTRALAEVFEGPLVRQLLSRRAKLRREHLGDPSGAAADLKKMYDLLPSDVGVMTELSALLTALGDHRAMVQLYEDQILRGKDLGIRAELARKVARLWDLELTDPREAADAWRRVLRMKPGDAEATTGLEQAKANMLKHSPPAEDVVPEEPVAAPTEFTDPRSVRPPPVSPSQPALPPSRPAAASSPAAPFSQPALAEPLAAPPSQPAAVLTAASPPSQPALELSAAPSHAVLSSTEDVPSLEPAKVETVDSHGAQGPNDPTGGRADEPLAANDATREHDAAGASGADIDIPVDDAGDEVVIADDLAEMLEPGTEAENDSTDDPLQLVKRSIPPPLPRG